MIKKSTLISILTISLVIVLAATFLIFSKDKANNKQIDTQNYLELSDFPVETNIEITYLNGSDIINDKIIIDNQDSKQLELNQISLIKFKISKNNDVYDVVIKTDTAKINIAATGLDPETKLSLKTDSTLSVKPVPVDWAGQIELTKNLTNKNFCLLIDNASICHRNKEVTI